jgi:mycothiol synthase
MIELRVAATDADYETWAAIKTRVIPSEPVAAAQLRATHEDGRLLLLAARDGVDAACGIGSLSGFGGLAFFGVRVLPEHRGHGVARDLTRALCDHARALGRDGVNAFVDATEPDSLAVAEHYGLREVDYQLQQAREIGEEPPPPQLPGVDVISLGDRREELLRAAFPLAEEAWSDIPVPAGALGYPLATWLREEATLPDGSFIAFELGQIVGYAGLAKHADPGTAEHGLTAVRRTHRGRGIARALKLAQLHWASHAGMQSLVTWTQAGNEPMQGLNRRLGYRDVAKVLTMQGPLPL